MKKIVALALVAIMVMALCGTALATTTPTYTNHEISTTSTTHTYEIYQIFKGNYDSTTKQLQNLVYGANANGTEDDAVTQADMTALAAIAEAEATSTYTDDQDRIAALEGYVNFNSSPVATIGKSGTDNKASLPEGFYVIKDKAGSVSDPDTYTLYIFQTLSTDLPIQAKDGTTTSEKQVQDNDAAGTWSDHADYNIGDDVPYKLIVTLPDNYDDYKEFYLKFKDDMCAGLTLNDDSVKIHYGATDTTGTTVAFAAGSGTSSYTGGSVFEYEIADLKTVSNAVGLGGGDIVWLTYTAKLNSSAVINDEGNKNTFTLEYSNNPNEDSSGTPSHGETPPDTTIVFTFESIFNKVDQDGNALTGADFELYKKVGTEWVKVTELHTGTGAINPSKTVGTSGTDFTFSGLDAGDYKLEETSTPDGYNSIEPIEFTIAATYDDATGTTKLETLTGTGTGITFTPNVPDAELEADIENKSGLVLPSTGGIGTTIFYISGLVMVLGAAAILVARRKAEAE